MRHALVWAALAAVLATPASRAQCWLDPDCLAGDPWPEYLNTTRRDTFQAPDWTVSFSLTQDVPPTGTRLRLVGGTVQPDSTGGERLGGASLELLGSRRLENASHAALRSGLTPGSSVFIESRPTAFGSGGAVFLRVSDRRDRGGPTHRDNWLHLGSHGLTYQGNPDDPFTINWGANIMLRSHPLSLGELGGTILLTRSEVPLDTRRVINIPDHDGTFAVSDAVSAGLDPGDPLRLDTRGVLSCPSCAELVDLHPPVTLGGPHDYVALDPGVQVLTLRRVDVSDDTNLTTAGGRDPIELTDDTLSCPTCLTTADPVRFTEEVTQINCIGSSAHSPFDAAVATGDQGYPAETGSAFGGYSFLDDDAEEDAVECSYRVPLAYEPAVGSVTFTIEGYGAGDADVPCSDDAEAVFELRFKTFVPGDLLSAPWQPAVPLMRFEVPCAGAPGELQHHTLAEAGVALADVEPGELLVMQVIRRTNDPRDSYDGERFLLMNGRLSYPVAR